MKINLSKAIFRVAAEALPMGKLKNFLLNLSGINISMNSFVGRGTIFIDEFRSGTISIGSNVAIAPACRLVSVSNSRPSKISNLGRYNKSGKVDIKDNVWIGTSSIILPNVTIGEHSIVGAGSVVTKSIGSYEIWYGNPAKFIKKLEME